MAGSTKKRAKARSKKKSKKTKKTTTNVKVEKRQGELWDKAFELESELEGKLLEDAIRNAQVALQELEEETRKMPFERRSGLRLREKAVKTERAFNRLRALRKGELLPERHPDEF